jgi:hypothetical protein
MPSLIEVGQELFQFQIALDLIQHRRLDGALFLSAGLWCLAEVDPRQLDVPLAQQVLRRDL